MEVLARKQLGSYNKTTFQSVSKTYYLLIYSRALALKVKRILRLYQNACGAVGKSPAPALHGLGMTQPYQAKLWQDTNISGHCVGLQHQGLKVKLPWAGDSVENVVLKKRG